MARQDSMRWTEHPDFSKIVDLAGCRDAFNKIGAAEALADITPDQAFGLRQTVGAIQRALIAPERLKMMMERLEIELKRSDLTPAQLTRLSNQILKVHRELSKVTNK